VPFAPITQVKPLDFFATHPVFTRTEFGAVRTRLARTGRTSSHTTCARDASARTTGPVRRRSARVEAASFTLTRTSSRPSWPRTLPSRFTAAFSTGPDVRSVEPVSRRHRTKVTAFAFRGSSFLPVDLPPGRAQHRGPVEERHAGGTVRVTSFERTLVDLVDAPDVGAASRSVAVAGARRVLRLDASSRRRSPRRRHHGGPVGFSSSSTVTPSRSRSVTSRRCEHVDRSSRRTSMPAEPRASRRVVEPGRAEDRPRPRWAESHDAVPLGSPTARRDDGVRAETLEKVLLLLDLSTRSARTRTPDHASPQGRHRPQPLRPRVRDSRLTST